VLLRREGEPSGINRIYRLYSEEGLTVRKRKARRKALGTRAPILIEARANTHRHCPRPHAKPDRRSAALELRPQSVIGTPLTSLGTEAYLQLGKRFRRDLVPNLIQQSEKIILTRLPECQPIQRH
jgi:hypothetical protein